MSDIIWKKTSRGFVKGEFTDHSNVRCSIQESSLATDAAIWFGCNDADPKQFVPHGTPKAWQSLVLPDNTICNTRMHLTRAQVKNLIPVLVHFAETGRIIEK